MTHTTPSTRRRHQAPTLADRWRAKPATLGDLVHGDDRIRGEAIRRRIHAVLSALDAVPAATEPADLVRGLDQALVEAWPDRIWLALAVLTARLPDVAAVQRTVRAARLDGPLPALFETCRGSGLLEATAWPDVEVVTGQVLVDLHHTARNLFATGIQRVAREAGQRWARDHRVVVGGWTEDYSNFRRLSDTEAATALGHPTEHPGTPFDGPVQAIVPWKCTLLLPELPTEPFRTHHYQAFIMFSGSRTGLVGHDCVPLTAAETTADGMPIGFANYLAAAARVDRIATTCVASQLEFQGWRTMLAGAGLTGPDIECVPLPSHAETPTPQALRDAQDLLGVGPLPMVLAVGSHEPRKNHLAVLHAAELLWREGLLFNLVFVGGNSWNSTAFQAQVDTLRQLNRPVQTILGLPDDLLWAAYRLAHCTVFPSLHEGFGLPVAESLASGTPVITSNFGSMADLASRGGALLVDPRNDRDLTDALRRLLLDPALRQRLADEAAALPRRSWDDYATETWDYLVNGNPPTTTNRGRPLSGQHS